MATTPEIRAWLVGNGHPELDGGRGRISEELRAEYEAAHEPPGDYDPGASPDDFGGDLPYVAADDPPDEPLGDSPDDGAGAAAAEDRPSRPRATRWTWGGRKRKAKPARGPRAKPGVPQGGRRISVAPMIEDAYADLAWAAGSIPPLQRLLYAQAPIAGTVLDDHAKGTFADGVLQPLARNYELGKVVTALVGTPAALMGVLVTAPGPVIDEHGRPVLVPVIDGATGEPNGQMTMAMSDPTPQHMASMLGLRLCVRAMADVAGGDSLRRVSERAAENAARDDQVNEFIAFLLGMQEVPPEAGETAAREARDAGLKLAGVGA